MAARKKAARALTIAELETINYSTGNNARSLENKLAQLSILATDAHYVARRAECRCRACEYLGRGRISGQAFTAWKCRICGDDQPMHPNTGVPRLCADCAKTYSLCATCGGDIETRHRGRRTGRKASL